jgi:hypothetical protein
MNFIKLCHHNPVDESKPRDIFIKPEFVIAIQPCEWPLDCCFVFCVGGACYTIKGSAAAIQDKLSKADKC